MKIMIGSFNPETRRKKHCLHLHGNFRPLLGLEILKILSVYLYWEIEDDFLNIVK